MSPGLLVPSSLNSEDQGLPGSLHIDRALAPERTRWLVQLRWVAVVGVFAVVAIAGPVLGVLSNPWPLFAVVFTLGAWNLALTWQQRIGRATVSPGIQVAVDLLSLWGLLFFSGGVRNPFSLFILFHVILGAILLPRRTAVRTGLWGAFMALSLAALEFVDWLPKDTLVLRATVLGKPTDFTTWGLALALVITLGVALHFSVTIMEDLRARGREAQRYHEEAERERRKLLDVVRSLGAGMVILDRGLRVEWQNDRSLTVLGTLEAKTPFRLPGGPPWPALEGLEQGKTLVREWQGLDTEGHLRLYQLSASPLWGEDALAQVVLIFADITDRRAAEQQLHRTEKLAALGRLAAGVAHEINTPLGSVSILTSEAARILPEAFRGDDEARHEVTEHLEDIRRETKRITTLVRRLLDLSHPGTEEKGLVHLPAVVHDAVRLISVRTPRSHQRIRVQVSDDTPVVTTVEDRLRQVLINILDNAIDATRTNEGSIDVTTGRTRDTAFIDVRDLGDGMDEDDVARAFDPFFTTKDVGEGTGLGLYVSYEIMKNLGGDISIASRAGEGTHVRLSLPTGETP